MSIYTRLAASYIALLIAQPALAQQTVRPAGPVSELDEVVVTARKTEERLQDVPVAVTAFGAEQLRERGIRQATDLQANTPSLTVATSAIPTRNSATYSMRGQGAPFGSPPGVITYFNGAPDRSAALPLFYDIGSIQVLKGPQGTLFGKTSTGGAVLVDPAKPGNAFDARAEVRLGNLDYRVFDGMVNVPVIDNVLAVRLAAQIARRDGYTKSLDDGKRYDDLHRDSARLSVRFTPTSAITNDAMLQWSSINENGGSQVLMFANPNVALLNLPAATFGAVCGGAAASLGVPAASVPAFVAGCTAQRLQILAGARNALTDEIARVRSGAQGGIRAFRSNGNLQYKDRSFLFINQFNYRIGDLGPLKNLTFKDIYSRNFGRNYINIQQLDGTNRGFLDQVVGPIYSTPSCVTSGPSIGFCQPGTATPHDTPDRSPYSNEVNVSATLFERLDILTGSFIQSTKGDERDLGIANAVGDNATQLFLQINPTNNGSTYSRTLEQGTFVQGNLDLGFLVKGLRISGGHRWTKTKGDVRTPTTPAAAVVIQTVTRSKAKTYTLSADWRIMDELLVYVRRGAGYKPGGSNALCVSSPIAGCTAAYDPETLKDIEFGAKTDWRFGDLTGRTNVAVYKSDYSDIQRRVSVLGSQYITNSAAARVKGFEVEHAMIYKDLTVSANYSHTNAKYTVWWDALAPNFPCTGDRKTNSRNDCVDWSGTAFQNTPKSQFNLTVRYNLPLDESIGRVTPQLSYYRQSRVTFSDNANTTRFSEFGSYAIMNGRIDWRGVLGKPIDLAVFARNITNKSYPNFIPAQYNALGWNAYAYAEPRTYGIEARYRFGASAE